MFVISHIPDAATANVPERVAQALIAERRWELIAQGLTVTLVISLCAGFLSLLLGLASAFLRHSGPPWVGRLLHVYETFMGGIPIVVVLMALYYVVLGGTMLNGAAIAVAAFTLSYGAKAGSIIWRAVQGLDPSQEEGAVALGYTHQQAFSKVVIPQAAQQFVPELTDAFIGMVKQTSVVGYIAVEDLTRVSDIIRTRSMDAVVPLVFTALIYFLLCVGAAALLKALTAHIVKPDRPRLLKKDRP